MRDLTKMIKNEVEDIFNIVSNISEGASAGEIDRVKSIIKLKLNVMYTNGRIDGMWEGHRTHLKIGEKNEMMKKEGE